MKRRTYIKSLMLGGISSGVVSRWSNQKDKAGNGQEGGTIFESDWHLWPDMKWVGPSYWGNRLQDWEIKDGRAVCNVLGAKRTLHVLTTQCTAKTSAFKVQVTVKPEYLERDKRACFGLLIGATGPMSDYRSAAVFGKGTIVGVTSDLRLQVGDQSFDTKLADMPKEFVLCVETVDNSRLLRVKVSDLSGHTLFTKEVQLGFLETLSGNFALYAHVDTEDPNPPAQESCRFSEWSIRSDEIQPVEDQMYGPVCFAQYTCHRDVLKLLVQCCPFEKLKKQQVTLEFYIDGHWKVVESKRLDHLGRVILFRIDNWSHKKDIPYRLLTTLGRNTDELSFEYKGTIACDPVGKQTLDVALFNCNAHYGFPDDDIVKQGEDLAYDLCMFLGDQFYESTGGFGAQYTGDFDRRCLDFLRKWLMFGWSYRELFRHKPCAIITDDHDVYHGNLWGSGGELADISKGFGYPSQDTGGYKMGAEWVNTLQFTQTGHLPDPYDPTPVTNGINVYYGEWLYGGISFALIEDRKFKSAPKSVLPPEAQVRNGFILNKEFDIKQHRNIDAQLLGARQEYFLKKWVDDWQGDMHMKVLISQTNFATIATLPIGSIDDNVVPKLKIPEKGEYILGDAPTVDMDSNGWPQKKRDESLAIIRKGMVFHIAGDQHLGTFVQYGIHEHGDAGFAFTGPALNNLWPRRFWPDPLGKKHTEQNPAYNGDHLDGFGNKFTLFAVANPTHAHKKPEVLHNRANGFGIVTFDKLQRTIKASCYRRFYNPKAADAQYPGWPIEIKQEDNLLTNARYYLPKLQYNAEKPIVLRVLDSEHNLLYSMRLPVSGFQPRVFAEGAYFIRLYEAGSNKQLKEFQVSAYENNERILTV